MGKNQGMGMGDAQMKKFMDLKDMNMQKCQEMSHSNNKDNSKNR